MRRRYQWDEIKKYYYKMVDTGKKNPQAKTREKFNIPLATLNDKIRKDGWELSEDQNASLKELSEVLPKVSDNFRNATERQKDIIDEKIYTLLEDNKITSNNRKIILAFQRIMGTSLEEEEITIKDIPSLMNAVEKMERVSNPPQKIEINNTNAQQNNFTPEEISKAIAESLPD